MLKVEDMSPAEMHALLQRESSGHLGCARDDRPYVVPMHYAYDGKEFYFFTTQGIRRIHRREPAGLPSSGEIQDPAHSAQRHGCGQARMR